MRDDRLSRGRHLEDKKPQIVTTCRRWRISRGGQPPGVVISGGVLTRVWRAGRPLAVEAFSKIHADVAIMGAGGITLKGITTRTAC